MEIERVLEGLRSADEHEGIRSSGNGTRIRRRKEGLEEDGGDSDSSLDLHTPLPYVFFLLVSLYMHY